MQDPYAGVAKEAQGVLDNPQNAPGLSGYKREVENELNASVTGSFVTVAMTSTYPFLPRSAPAVATMEWCADRSEPLDS